MINKIKYLIPIVSIMILIVLGVIGLLEHQNKLQKIYQKRYEEMESEIDKSVKLYLSVVAPYCLEGQSYNIGHRTLVNDGGLDKEKLLDVDNKSYCKVYITNRCVESGNYFNDIPGKMEWEVNLKCKYRKDKGFKKLDEPYEPKE